MTLAELKAGKTAVVISVGGVEKLRCRLLDLGLVPETEVKVCKTAPFGDPVEISLRGYRLTIRKDDAAKISVRPKGEAGA